MRGCRRHKENLEARPCPWEIYSVGGLKQSFTVDSTGRTDAINRLKSSISPLDPLPASSLKCVITGFFTHCMKTAAVWPIVKKNNLNPTPSNAETTRHDMRINSDNDNSPRPELCSRHRGSWDPVGKDKEVGGSIWHRSPVFWIPPANLETSTPSDMN